MKNVLMARMANRTVAMLQVTIFFVLDAVGIAKTCRALTLEMCHAGPVTEGKPRLPAN